jgi:hypothetical protein
VLERRRQLHPERATPEPLRAELTLCLLRAASEYGDQRGDRRFRLLATAEHLIAEGADPDFFDPRPGLERNVSPLHEALRVPYMPEMIKLLLDHGARTTFVFADGRTETALDAAKRTLHAGAVSWMEGADSPSWGAGQRPARPSGQRSCREAASFNGPPRLLTASPAIDTKTPRFPRVPLSYRSSSVEVPQTPRSSLGTPGYGRSRPSR